MSEISELLAGMSSLFVVMLVVICIVVVVCNSVFVVGCDKEDRSDVPDSDSSDSEEDVDGTTKELGLRAMRYEWKALETFQDKECADKFRKSLPFAHTWHSGGHGQTQYKCRDHENCEHYLKVAARVGGKYVVSSRGQHSEELSKRSKLQSIWEEVNDMLRAGNVPSVIHTHLITKYHNKAAIIPTLSQLQNRSTVLKRQAKGTFQVQCVAHLKEWIEEHLLPNELPELGLSNDLYVLPGSFFEEGFAFSSLKLLDNAAKFAKVSVLLHVTSCS